MKTQLFCMTFEVQVCVALAVEDGKDATNEAIGIAQENLMAEVQMQSPLDLSDVKLVKAVEDVEKLWRVGIPYGDADVVRDRTVEQILKEEI